uniref:Uncharacterized protein n=1 Tax=Lotharella oceanica TaxID=641309 RepID=A0A7S2TN96_9EUKA
MSQDSKKQAPGTLQVQIVPPKTSRPEPDFKIRLPWENRADQGKAARIPKTGRPRPRPPRRSKQRPSQARSNPKSEMKANGLLNIPVNNPDLPKVLERDNSFMLPADHPDVEKIFGQFRGVQLKDDENPQATTSSARPEAAEKKPDDC